MISFSFFSVMVIISFQIFTMKYKWRKYFTTQSCTPLVPCFTFQILLFESFYKILIPMNKILRIWRYVTIGVIVSLLTLSIFVLGCTTGSIPKKDKKSEVMNDPNVTYWYCWWWINRYCTDSFGFKFYIDKILSVYTIRMEPSLRDFFIDSRQIQEF